MAPTPRNGRRLVALPAQAGPWLVEAIQRAWEHDEAICVVDTASPRLRERLDVLRPHVLRLPKCEVLLEPGAPLLGEQAWMVQVTSGTTGTPRAIVLDEIHVRASANAVGERLAITPRDGWVTALSPAFIGGLATIARSIVAGIPIQLLPRHREDLFRRALEQGATLATTVASALARIDVTPLRAVVLGAQPARGSLPSNAISSYGMTETGSGVVYDGLPLPGVAVAVREGVIRLRGPMIAERTRDGSPVTDVDGWLTTGDVGELVDGRLRVLGRIDDLINTGGVHVPPAPVEAAVLEVLGSRVRDAVVYATADERFGEAVTLAVVADEVPSIDELRALLAERLDAAWIPRRIVAVAAIPRTETGKPLRRLLPGAHRGSREAARTSRSSPAPHRRDLLRG